MKAIAVSPNGSPWVVTEKNEIYRRKACNWQKLPGRAMDVAHGPNGSAWILGDLASASGYDILRWNEVAWKRVEGAAVRISVGPDGLPWIVNAEHEVFRLSKGDRWERIGTRATEVAVGGDGSVWSLGMPEDCSGDGCPISRWTGVKWEQVEGAAVRIAVGRDGLPWVINSRQILFHLNADGEWQEFPLLATDIAVGSNGRIWVVGASQTYHDTPDFIAVGPGGLWWPAKPPESGEAPAVFRIRRLSMSSVPRKITADIRLFAIDVLSDKKLVRNIRNTTHFQEVTWPVLTEIDEVYARFIFRSPTHSEIARHLYRLSMNYPTLESRRRLVRQSSTRQHLDIRPLSLEIDITNQCNLRCIMCHFSHERFSKRKREDISVEEFRKTADQLFPLCQVVILQSATEPLLHKRFAELLRITKSYGVPRVGMTTNGLLLNEKLIQDVVHMMETITISMDAATKCTYERIRRKGNFDRLVANIRALTRAKKRRGRGFPIIGISFVMMRSNISELPAFVRLAHELGVSSVTAAHLTPFEGLNMENETLDKDPDLCNRMLDEARAHAEKLGIEIFLPAKFTAPAPRGSLIQIGTSALLKSAPKLAEDSSDAVDSSVCDPSTRRDKHNHGVTLWGDEHKRHCLYPWHFVVINPYGEVYPCGWWFEQSMGNIRNDSFETIWNNHGFKALRREHESGVLGNNCRNCSATGMGNVNRQGAFVVRKA